MRTKRILFFLPALLFLLALVASPSVRVAPKADAAVPSGSTTWIVSQSVDATTAVLVTGTSGYQTVIDNGIVVCDSSVVLLVFDGSSGNMGSVIGVLPVQANVPTNLSQTIFVGGSANIKTQVAGNSIYIGTGPSSGSNSANVVHVSAFLNVHISQN